MGRDLLLKVTEQGAAEAEEGALPPSPGSLHAFSTLQCHELQFSQYNLTLPCDRR